MVGDMEPRRLILIPRAVLAREPKRAAHGFENATTDSSLSFIPIFLSRRKRKPEQIGRRGKQATAHTQAKCGALEQSRRRIPGGWQPPAALLGKVRGHNIKVHCVLNLAGKSRFEQIGG